MSEMFMHAASKISQGDFLKILSVRTLSALSDTYQVCVTVVICPISQELVTRYAIVDRPMAPTMS